jgi:hexokinase
VFARICPDAQIDPGEGSGPLVRLRASGAGRAREVAGALLDRSADLVAAGLHGVARVLGGDAPITVLAEGSLFWKADGYADRVERTLEQLAPDGPPFRIAKREDVNLFGSAAAALS